MYYSCFRPNGIIYGCFFRKLLFRSFKPSSHCNSIPPPPPRSPLSTFLRSTFYRQIKVLLVLLYTVRNISRIFDSVAAWLYSSTWPYRIDERTLLKKTSQVNQYLNSYCFCYACLYCFSISSGIFLFSWQYILCSIEYYVVGFLFTQILFSISHPDPHLFCGFVSCIRKRIQVVTQQPKKYDKISFICTQYCFFMIFIEKSSFCCLHLQ